MTWQIAATIIAVIVPVLGILNAWLLNQVRISISGLKIEMLQMLVKNNDDMRAWVSSEFQRKEEAHARTENVFVRLAMLETLRDQNRAA